MLMKCVDVANFESGNLRDEKDKQRERGARLESPLILGVQDDRAQDAYCTRTLPKLFTTCNATTTI